jgi:ABC-2 type transport system ATP-binding protein
MTSPLVEADRLQIRYGSRRVLDGVSFAVQPGSVFAILGRNGAGKSSLMRCLVGLDRPASGRALLFGGDPWKTRVKAMARTGVVPEEPDASPDMFVKDLVTLCASFHSKWDTAGVHAQLKRLRVPLDIRFGDLSRGQKTVTMLALALGHHPELLILDDPTLGLDPVAKRSFLSELVDELSAHGTTVIVTTQELPAVERFADRVAILGEHRLLLDEPLEGLKGRFRRIRGKAGADFSMFKAGREVDRPWGREAVVIDYDDAKFERWRQMNGDGEVASMSLEDIFVEVAEEPVA